MCVVHNLLRRRLTVAPSRRLSNTVLLDFLLLNTQSEGRYFFFLTLYISLLFPLPFVAFLPLHLSPPPVFPSVTDVCGNGLTLHPWCVIWGIWGVTCNRKATDLGFAVCLFVTLMLRWATFFHFQLLTFKLKSVHQDIFVLNCFSYVILLFLSCNLIT